MKKKMLKALMIGALLAGSIFTPTVDAADRNLSDDSSDFVLLADVVPDIIQEIRYYSTYNFVGDRVDGYTQPVALMTKEAAIALKAVSDDVMQYGYRLKVYDAYRPQKAVDNFVRWAEDIGDTRMKDYFYPLEDKTVLFDKGYIALYSGHSRGSTVDLTLFDMRTGKEVDMGGTFDYFGLKSHPDYVGDLTQQQIDNRNFLRDAMLRHGFKPLEEEWWHFTLRDEPYPDTYFTFDSNVFADARHMTRQLHEQNVQALLWMENAAEYRELCYQAYNIALERIDAVLKSKKKFKKPLAIVLDIDETVLSSAAWNASYVGTDRKKNTDDEVAWAKSTKAEPLPGAVEFLKAVDKRGVEIFYVTNRNASRLAELTKEDLEEAGFPTVKPDHLFLKSDGGDKFARLDRIADKYEVIVYMGDNAGDFPLGTFGRLTAERNEIVDRHQKDFGVKYIVFPNPLYGSWRYALANGYGDMTPQQQDVARRQALRK